MRTLSRTARRYWQPVFYLAVANFAAFWVVAGKIGGDAVNGRAEGGRYFLRNHGARTEVSRAVYNYSLVHTVSVWTTHGLAFAGGLVPYALGRLYGPQPASGAGGE